MRANAVMNQDHKEDRHSLYGAHNFLVADGKETFGIFVDYPGIIRFDVGYTRSEELVITASDWNLDVYIITGEDIKDIVKTVPPSDWPQLHCSKMGIWLRTESLELHECRRSS
mgnify:CR=1 FL=1